MRAWLARMNARDATQAALAMPNKMRDEMDAIRARNP